MTRILQEGSAGPPEHAVVQGGRRIRHSVLVRMLTRLIKLIGYAALTVILLAGPALLIRGSSKAEEPVSAERKALGEQDLSSLCILAEDPETETLDLDAAGLLLTDADALSAVIDLMPKLREVRMYDSPMATEDMEKLFDRYYPRVFFGFTLRIGPHEIRTDQTAFSTLHLVGKMKGDERHTSEELFPIRMCTRLKALDLGHNYLTDIGFLNTLTELEVLIISPNYGLKDIGPVANCNKLVYLECFNTPITDLSPLAGLTELRDLNLTRDAQIRDISPLYELQKLERVWWGSMNKVRTDQRKIMREKHRDCKFVSVYDPTGGGWRRHSHFTELHTFFRTGVYVPFSE